MNGFVWKNVEPLQASKKFRARGNSAYSLTTEKKILPKKSSKKTNLLGNGKPLQGIALLKDKITLQGKIQIISHTTATKRIYKVLLNLLY